MKKKLNICIITRTFGKKLNRALPHEAALAQQLRQKNYSVSIASRKLNIYYGTVDIKGILSGKYQADIYILAIPCGESLQTLQTLSWIINCLGKPLVFWIHSSKLNQLIKKTPDKIKDLFSLGNAIVIPCSYYQKMFKNLNLNVRIIYNGIDLQKYKYRLRKKVAPSLLWMRTFNSPVYNPEMALKVIEVLKGSYPNIHLTLAGQQPKFSKKIRQIIKEKKLKEYITVKGLLSSEGKKRAFNCHDIFLNTNRLDHAPVSLVEAGASGLPIITTNVGGIPYLFKNRQTAILIKNEDTKNMAKAVKKLIETPTLARKLSKNGRKLAKNHNWPKIINTWSSLFREILKNYKNFG